MITNRTDINDLLAQMRDLKAQATNGREIQPRSNLDGNLTVGNTATELKSSAPQFSEMFSNAINAVNETQKTSSALATAYQQGDPGVSLTQVMVASQKASVSFQAVTEVRNKLVEAYKDVMNMPI